MIKKFYIVLFLFIFLLIIITSCKKSEYDISAEKHDQFNDKISMLTNNLSKLQSVINLSNDKQKIEKLEKIKLKNSLVLNDALNIFQKENKTKDDKIKWHKMFLELDNAILEVSNSLK